MLARGNIGRGGNDNIKGLKNTSRAFRNLGAPSPGLHFRRVAGAVSVWARLFLSEFCGLGPLWG